MVQQPAIAQAHVICKIHPAFIIIDPLGPRPSEHDAEWDPRAGESDPIAMSTVSEHNQVHESRNIAFMSSQVLNGEGRAIVVRCGDNTFIGKINELASGQGDDNVTTLQRDINMFVKFIAVVAITMAIILFSAGMGREMDFADAFVNGLVVVLVANIPQVCRICTNSGLNCVNFWVVVGYAWTVLRADPGKQ